MRFKEGAADPGHPCRWGAARFPAGTARCDGEGGDDRGARAGSESDGVRATMLGARGGRELGRGAWAGAGERGPSGERKRGSGPAGLLALDWAGGLGRVLGKGGEQVGLVFGVGLDLVFLFLWFSFPFFFKLTQTNLNSRHSTK